LRFKKRVPATYHEMFDAIDDVMAEHNTHEENTDGDEEGIETGTRTGLDAEFDALSAELPIELYPGCTWMSFLNFLAKLMHLKVINKWADTSFDQLFEL
jgi:hypothetical protein